jgi:hypothetical protein
MPRGQTAAAAVQTVVLLLVLALAGPTLGQQPAPEPSPSPTPAAKPQEGEPARRPRRLVLDIDKHVEQKLAEEARFAPPRFETSIEVVARTPQMLLERYFGGVDLECAPAGSPPGGGAPTVEEMRGARPHTSPTGDLLALVSALAGQVGKFVKSKDKDPAPPRYYLYKVVRKDAVSWALREDRVPDAWFYNFPELSFELVDTFSNKDTAVRAWKRMERGFATPVAPKVESVPSWVSVNCRPRR